MKTDLLVDELMECFTETINKCGLYLLERSDNDIEYNIFEEFDIGSISFLHEESLLKLKSANLISDEIMHKSIDLRKRVISLQDTELWDVNSVRTAAQWREILELSDEIKLLLNNNSRTY